MAKRNVYRRNDESIKEKVNKQDYALGGGAIMLK